MVMSSREASCSLRPGWEPMRSMRFGLVFVPTLPGTVERTGQRAESAVLLSEDLSETLSRDGGSSESYGEEVLDLHVGDGWWW